MLEPCEAKVSRTVLRGLGAGNRAWLLGDPSATLSSFHQFPGVAGYTVSFSPPISQRDEQGFSSFLAHPCHRAVAMTPPECLAASVSLRRSMLPSPQDGRLGPWASVSRPFLRSLSLRPDDSLTIRRWLCR